MVVFRRADIYSPTNRDPQSSTCGDTGSPRYVPADRGGREVIHMELDVVLLSRIQFALTIMFHYLFPPLTIGLGVILVVMEGTFLKTGNPQYEAMTRFWTKIFAVNFAMGVATGIVMEFEFGTNWATYSRFVGDVFGSALAAEGIFAFFLESGFLAVLVFGWDRVSPRMHFFSTIMVALGAIFSSIWIVIANSWMQTPAGYHLVGEGLARRAEITDFWAMVFNPSSIPRLVHVWVGALVIGSFVVMSISAWYLLRRRHVDFAQRSFTIALVVGTIASLGTLVSGHYQADNVAEHQPAKLAAFEGHFVTGDGGADMWLFGVPDVVGRRVNYGIAIPRGLSLLIHFDTTTPVPGLDKVPREDWPRVEYVFQTYHGMVAIGTFLIALTLLGSFLRWRGTFFEHRWLLWIFVFGILFAHAGNQLGWMSAEMGRQPWIVYGLLRTSDAVSKSITGGMVLASIVMFSAIYFALFLMYLYVLNSKISHGPEPVPEMPQTTTTSGLVEAAARLANPAGFSLSGARGDDEPRIMKGE
jgi:cytochrome bd ubiquinol oxidase subunit I